VLVSHKYFCVAVLRPLPAAKPVFTPGHFKTLFRLYVNCKLVRLTGSMARYRSREPTQFATKKTESATRRAEHGRRHVSTRRAHTAGTAGHPGSFTAMNESINQSIYL